MASTYSPLWMRFLFKATPFLFKKCPQWNYHWRWDRLCMCGLNEYCGDFRGGIYDMKKKKQYYASEGHIMIEDYPLPDQETDND